MTTRDLLTVREYGASPGSHRHDHAQLLVGLEGVLQLEVDGTAQRVAPGEALLVTPGRHHDFEAPRGGSRCLVLDSTHPLWAASPAQPRDLAQVGALARYLAEAVRADAPLARLHGPALLLEAWAPRAATSRPRRRIDWEALAAWVQAHLGEPLTLAEMSARVHLSPSQFALRCHEAQGLAPLEWLRAQRLAKARELRALGLAVADVARRTGYRSPSALTAALRRSQR